MIIKRFLIFPQILKFDRTKNHRCSGRMDKLAYITSSISPSLAKFRERVRKLRRLLQSEGGVLNSRCFLGYFKVFSREAARTVKVNWISKTRRRRQTPCVSCVTRTLRDRRCSRRTWRWRRGWSPRESVYGASEGKKEGGERRKRDNNKRHRGWYFSTTSGTNARIREDTKGRDLGRNARKNISNFTNLSPAIEPAERTRENGEILANSGRNKKKREEWWKKGRLVGASTEDGIEKEFELGRIRLAVVVGGDRRRKIGYRGRDKRGCGFARGFASRGIDCGEGGWVEGGRELSQQLSAQLAGFISIGTICRAK